MPAVNTGLYLHIPFCAARCTYCDFNTYVGMNDLHQPYVRALQMEIRGAVKQWDVRSVGDTDSLSHCPTANTIFFGGGTPSLLQPDQIGALIRTCRESFEMPVGGEITMECNPGSVTLDYLRAVKAQGVNRLSFGAQSADLNELKLLGREHSFEQVVSAIRNARAAGFEAVNVDLIFGLPHQHLETWQRTLDSALEIDPDHISLYALTIEQGTPMHDWVRRGEVPYPDPDAAADMYEYAERTLGAAGYDHYEISNWCKPGHECQHNLIYWRNEPYFGLGAGAHSSSINRRWWNVRRPADYIARAERGESVEMNHEDIDPRASRGETMMLGLRLLNEGVSQARFAERHGGTIHFFYEKELEEGVKLGLLDVNAERVKLTERGHFLSNRAMEMFV
jgi:oxygen-independent coproporphyrinogen-3 oxidase